MNILIALPTPDQVSPSFAFGSLPDLIAYTKTNVLKDGDNLMIAYQQGVRTDRNRNELLKKALDADIDYILWLDTDMIYPKDMIEKFLAEKADVIGCLYFKRGYPFAPVAYYKGDNPNRPYIPVDVRKTPEKAVLSVDGMGFGGLMVKMSVYRMLTENERWHNYGGKYHIPYENDDALSHDLVFCKLLREKYNVDIKLHTGVEAGHLCEVVVDRTWWKPEELEDSNPTISANNINTKEYWDNKYTNHSHEYGNQHIKQTARWVEVLPYLEANDGLMDLGCGVGEFLSYVNDNVSIPIAYGGIDISSVAIDTTATKVPNGRFYVADLMNLDQLPNKCDVVFCGETLEHVDNPEKIFALAKQALNTNGRFIITTPLNNAIKSPEHVHSFSIPYIEELFDKYGFENVNIKTLFEDKVIFAVGFRP